jgi:hypothetical protein
LSPKQAEAFKELERSFRKCSRLKIIVWDNYGQISALNGNKVTPPETAGSHNDEPGELLDCLTVPSFSPKCWASSNADDPLYINKA